MKEQYMKQVKHALIVPRKQKNEILRDLKEAFASAEEHGETPQQLIERLGTPSDYVNDIHDQLGINPAAHHKRKVTIALTLSAAAFAVGIMIAISRIPGNIIGQADAMTNIQIIGTTIDPITLLIAGGTAMLMAAIGLIIRYRHDKEL